MVRLPERVLRRLKKCEALCLCEHDSTLWIHVCLFELRISCVICASSVLLCGSVGSSRHRESRSMISRLEESVRLGILLGMWPRGMYFLEALVMTRRNSLSPVLQEESKSRLEKPSSVSQV